MSILNKITKICSIGHTRQARRIAGVEGDSEVHSVGKRKALAQQDDSSISAHSSCTSHKTALLAF